MSDCELPQYYVCKEPVARKRHGCCECRAPIEPGEKYLQVNASWDKSPCVERQHLLCAEACMLVRDAGLNDDECLAYGELKLWYENEVKDRWSWPYVAGEMDARRKLWRLMLRITRRERMRRIEELGK